MPDLVIACDESGFSGSNLLDPEWPEIVHASVDLTVPEAAGLIAAVRTGRGAEYKSNRLLRPEERPALEWFLRQLDGRAHVHRIDKRTYVARRVLELFTGEPSYGDGTRLGRAFDVRELRERTAFLDAFLILTRTKRLRLLDHDAIDQFFAHGPPELSGVSRAHVEQTLLRLIDDDPAIPPPLEPLVPALAETVLFWGAGGRSVGVVHDEQSALTRRRVARLRAYLAEFADVDLAGFEQVDSRQDPRVQVADLLAGIARRGDHDVEDRSTAPTFRP
ncbi:hypothetical protein HPO96_29480 [Kribbella sandramycini]|uniref:DUF3800 domain-containing protein n=1 Tax=Kribbella sandramycini TaxID=60450 RepID=A0A7Y4L740_9ACTN|nr:hypothetical protein [Kribbella sandramycini]MBB6571743.1 hypothetical protein [Kribbella sandramycini]NOL44386.1 hypothetical protein [Kribbella sandramycini]